MAGLLDISQPAVSTYLQGRIPPPEVLLKIAELGSTTVEWILTGRDASAQSPHRVRERQPVYGNESVLVSLWKKLPEKIQRDVLNLLRHLAETIDYKV
ncbi:MAG: hypothetical protein GWN00_34490 [Aliifodinibius sp.]|nr:helix-turn-helix transcriptional regulator [candidate division Zixibacteria bacterium]NIT61132.1 helix-turn-helix transcriptional regulator [Fodinibius sp.]NIS48588.1 helix-turn-helix transcriptional regulator [candidate division Zixibacteria bacterium]NIU13123.1 helix-turn-helix transcriptional regulator [candidate division Zixibacteria bacterium]NIV08827.1 hypothetical protein [candidate division Zixibacteria bacterium]